MYADDTCVCYSGADINGDIGVFIREFVRVINCITGN